MKKNIKYTALLIIVFITGLYLGNLIRSNYDQNWILNNRQNTQSIIDNSKQIYQVHHQLVNNYSSAYNTVIDCWLGGPNKCNPSVTSNSLNDLKTQRDSLNNQLTQLDQETKNILDKLP